MIRFNVKRVLPTLMAGLFTVSVHAGNQYTDKGRVLSVTDQTQSINLPSQECRTEYGREGVNAQRHSIVGSVIGGIAGGLLGSTIGKGRGRVAAAAVGAGIGAITGDRVSRRNRGNGQTRSVPYESCYQVDNWQTVKTGYLVDYEYNGRRYSTVTKYNPGRYIDVNVTVEPNVQHVSRHGRHMQLSEYSDASIHQIGGRRHQSGRHSRRHFY